MWLRGGWVGGGLASLGQAVLAEGVESLVDQKLLREYGCNEVQGYLYARPLPPREMARWLQGQAPVAAQSDLALV